MVLPKHMHALLVAAVAGSLVASGWALAQTQTYGAGTAKAPPAQSTATTQMPSVTPSKSETAASAFEKLDKSHLGYVTRADAAKLNGFDKAFEQADKDKDGKLSRAEFNAAWAIYTGKG